MRKNYFAKKFVAYSMAFAVAFSTLTVSPVFVKEAKAADSKMTVAVTGTDIDGILDENNAAANYVKDGIKWIDTSSVVTSDATVTTSSIALENLVAKTGLAGFGQATVAEGATSLTSAYTTVKQLATDGPYVLTNGTANAKATSLKVNSKGYTLSNLPAGSINTVEDVAYLFNGVDNIKQQLPVNNDANGESVVWLKLMPTKGEYEDSKTVGSTVTKATVKYNYFVAQYLTTVSDPDGAGTNRQCNYDLGTVTSDKLGLYLAVRPNPDGTLGKVLAAYNVCERTDLLDSGVVAARKATTYAQLGTDVKLSVDVNTARTNANLTYKWSKDTKAIDCTSATLEIKDIKDADYGYYLCEISDGLTTKKQPVTLSKLGTTELATAKSRVYAIESDLNVLKLDNSLVNNTASINTSIPNGDYKYIWAEHNTSTNSYAPVTLSENDVMSYSGTERGITLATTKSYANTKIVCFAVPVIKYNEKLEATEGVVGGLADCKKAVEDATTIVTKHTALQTLRQAEINYVTNDNTEEYTETFSLNLSDDLNVSASRTEKSSVVKFVKFGETITLDAPTAVGVKPTYTWTDEDGTTRGNNSKLVIDTIDQQDLGQFTVSVNSCTVDHTHVENAPTPCSYTVNKIVTYNLIYVSDLQASGVDTVVAKKDQKNVEFKVTASGSLNPTYTWKKSIYNTSWPSYSNCSGVFNEATYKFDAAAGTFYTGDKAGSVKYKCVVDDGIKTIEIPVKLTELETYKLYKNKQDAEAEASELTANNTPITLANVKGTEEKLAPVVVSANEEVAKEITYKWTKSGVTVGTDSELVVKYPESGSEVYVYTVTEGTKTLQITYTLNAVTDKQIEDKAKTLKADTDDFTIRVNKELVYTGEKINPIVSLSTEISPSNVYTLVEGEDYVVELEDAVNTGYLTGKYTVKFIGKFADVITTGIATGKELEGRFSIIRADNEVTVEDKTVVLGGSVQPKTTNKAGAAVTYTYYADADCTTALEAAPTKVGTYYVKATSIATTNYNEAESNVAKVVVVPGKVKMLGTSRTASSVKLNWTKATGATSYRVYYKAPGAKSYKVFKNTTATSMNVTGLASATTYTFAVKAYAKTAGYSTVYATKQTTTAPAKVATPSVTAGSKKATVKFTKVARATGYQIYMAKGNGKYVKVKTTTSTSFTKTGLAKGATYKFKVRAYKTVGSNTYYGAFSSAKAVKVK